MTKSTDKAIEDIDEEDSDDSELEDSIAQAASRSGKIDQSGTLSFKTVKNIFSKQKKIALIIDAPNILRRVNNRQIRLEDIEKIASKFGQIKIAKVILNRHAPKNLLKAIENSGYEPIVATADIYIRMAIEIMDSVFSKNVDIVIIASRHARCAPILRAAKANGLDTAIIGFQPGFSIAVKNAADMAFQLEI
ncbi:MAG: NYN domain-containing protein [Candidatus Heimdallarchaeota archaeon]|nr:NYN domain-containing protein [Candidatus Heimdallarchaeota archaeon]